jgi:hypothetical protein
MGGQQNVQQKFAFFGKNDQNLSQIFFLRNRFFIHHVAGRRRQNSRKKDFT